MLFRSQEFAEFLIDQGANMVVGTAASSLQKVDRYRNGLIFYNIGHIASPPNIISYNKESVILHIAITTEKQLEIMAVPIFTNHADVKIAKGPLVKSKIFARLGARSWRLDL